jgi:itaconyl-CoA hydratase
LTEVITDAHGYEGWWEDFEVGDVFRHSRRRTATSIDNYVLTLLSLNTANPHVYRPALSTQPERTFSDLPLPGWAAITSLVVGITSRDLAQRVVTEVGFDAVRVLHPVYAGDTIGAESTVVESERIPEREDRGMVRFRTTAFNHERVPVWRGDRIVHVLRRPGERANS